MTETLTVPAVLLKGDRAAAVGAVDLPPRGTQDALVEIRMAAVCGSDLPHFRAPASELGNRLTTAPGHEAVGVVVEAGEGGPAVGTRVIVYQHSGCGRCEFCVRGEPMFCMERATLGNHRHGANAAMMVAPVSSLIQIPDDIDDQLAALISCNFGTAFMGFSKTGATVADRVVVVGLGPVGACVVIAAAAAGCHVIAVDPIPARRELAERLGARSTIDPMAVDPVEAVRSLTEGRGAEVVVECSANRHAQVQAMKAVRVQGSVLLLGANNSMEIDPGLDVIRKELRIQGSWVFKLGEVPQVLRAARQMLPQLRELLTEPVSWRDAPEAFTAADQGRAGKTFIDWVGAADAAISTARTGK